VRERHSVKSKALNKLRRLSTAAIQASIHKTNTSWVIHLHTISELEYLSK